MRLVKETEGASHLVVGSYLQVRVPPDEAVSRDVLGEERIKVVVTTIIKIKKKIVKINLIIIIIIIVIVIIMIKIFFIASKKAIVFARS